MAGHCPEVTVLSEKREKQVKEYCGEEKRKN